MKKDATRRGSKSNPLRIFYGKREVSFMVVPTITSSSEALSADEFAALKQIGMSFSRGTIPRGIRERLILLGYAREILSYLTITNAGLARLAGVVP